MADGNKFMNEEELVGSSIHRFGLSSCIPPRSLSEVLMTGLRHIFSGPWGGLSGTGCISFSHTNKFTSHTFENIPKSRLSAKISHILRSQNNHH